MFFFPKNLHTLTVLGIYQSGLSAGQNAFNRRPDLISVKCHFLKIRDHFFISAPIFKMKVSMERSHQCSLNGVVLGAVREILMKTCFVRNGFSLISQDIHRCFPPPPKKIFFCISRRIRQFGII